MNLWFKLALRELNNNRRFTLFFIFNLALGLVGFIILVSFKSSLENHLQNHSRNILTADLAASAYSPISLEEQSLVESVLDQDFETAKQISFYSMVSSPESSKLIQIMAVDQSFPLYGALLLEGKQKGNVSDLGASNSIWVYPELLVHLNVSVGDFLTIGDQKFKIIGTISDDPTNVIFSFGFAPRIYMGINQVEKTGLMQRGSRIAYHHFYKIANNQDPISLAEKIQVKLKAKGFDQKIRIMDHQNAGQRMGRILGTINEFLGLIALVALFLASIGTAYLFRTFLNARIKSIAILMSLGVQRRDAQRIILIQLSIMGLVAAAISVLLMLVFLPLLPLLIQDLMPKNFTLSYSGTSLLFAFILGTAGSIVFCLPTLGRIRNFSPLLLFNEGLGLSEFSKKTLWLRGISFLPGVILFWLLAIWQLQSLLAGSLFIALFFAALLVFSLITLLFFVWVGKKTFHGGVAVKIAFRNLSRNRIAATSCFLSIALGAMLLNLIPQIQNGIQDELQRPAGLTLPDFFLVDIQPEQLEPLKKYLSAEGVSLANISPMIRSRVEQINGNPFVPAENTGNLSKKLVDARRNFRRWGGNLSYRSTISKAERIVEGEEIRQSFDPDSKELPKISLGKQLAANLGINVGDVLTFDIQGVSIEGQVVNLREVRWNSFQPNFYILFQPGVLEEAPKSYLASIPSVDKSKTIELQTEIVRQFPNISLIDISRAVSKIMEITDQMSWALKFMAYLSILVGIVVVFSIAQQEARSRRWETNLLKVLGATFRDVRVVTQIEFAILGFGAAIFGVLLSLITSYIISIVLFEELWRFSGWVSLASVLLIGFLTLISASLATQGILKQKPVALLRAI